MTETVILVALAAALAAIGLYWRKTRIRHLSMHRLADPASATTRWREVAGQPFVRRHLVYPWAVGLLVAAALIFAVGLSYTFALTFGAIVGLLLNQWEAVRVSRQRLRIEVQLSDAIDLMVGSLHAGAGALAALEQAVVESRAPLRPQFEEVLGRIRYGDKPAEVLQALLERVPLATFRLFASVLSVHWEVGGSLTAPLSVVGRTIRDRIELTRRLGSITAQARASTMAILALTYFIALVMWRNDPEHMREFLATSIGQFLVAGAILLQGLGIVWSASMSHMNQ